MKKLISLICICLLLTLCFSACKSDDKNKTDKSLNTTKSSLKEDAESVGDRVSEKVSDAGEKVSEKVSEAGEKVSEKLSEAGSTLKEDAEKASEEASDAVSDR